MGIVPFFFSIDTSRLIVESEPIIPFESTLILEDVNLRKLTF